MKSIVFTILWFINFSLTAQVIGNCIEILGTDSIKLYYRNPGVLVDKECADYFRIAKINHDNYVFDGHSQDYYATGQLAIDCYYNNNFFNGHYNSYYPNGQIEQSGLYIDGQKNGEWNYWYENGLPKKTIIFSTDDYYIKEVCNRQGKKIVVDGNGVFQETGLIWSSTITGEVRQGKQHGKWIIHNNESDTNTSEELFNNGKFVAGQNIAENKDYNFKYSNNATSLFDLTNDLTGSYKTKADCLPKDRHYTFHRNTYNSNYSSLRFYNYIYQNFDPDEIDKGYILAGFNIDTKGNLINANIYSTINNKKIEDSFTKVLNSCDRWTPASLNYRKYQSNRIIVVQFYNGSFKMLDDLRNDLPPVDCCAQYKNVQDSLKNLVENEIVLPQKFMDIDSRLATSISFSINQQGSVFFDDSIFYDGLAISKKERKLYEALKEVVQKTDGKWSPASYNNQVMEQHFIGVFNINNGVSKFRLFSHNPVIN